MSISEDDLQDDGERHKVATPLTGKALLQQLYNHRAMMAPHQKERHAGKLLLECITEIERLVQVNKDLLHLQDANNNLFKVARKYCVENKKLRIEIEHMRKGASMAIANKEEMSPQFVTQCCERAVQTQCCEGSPQQHEAENRMGN